MFEIGFAELLLLGTIALLVVGPDRLPGLVRTLGVWVGRAQRLVGQVRADIEREVRADELRRAAKEYSPAATLSDMRKEVEDFANEVSKPVEPDGEEPGPELTGTARLAPGKSEAEQPEAGKPASDIGKPAETTAPAAPLAVEPEADAAGAKEPEPAGEAPPPEATTTDARPETIEPASDMEPAACGTDSTAAPAVIESAAPPPAETDERSAAA